jgi:hypothetical protein
MKAKVEGQDCCPSVLEAQDVVSLLNATHHLCNHQNVCSMGIMELLTLERILALVRTDTTR